MRPRAILAIDQGSTSSKAVIYDEKAQAIGRASCAVETRYPQAGWVEQDPEQVWRSVVEAVRACLDAAPVEIAAIGVTNQRESALIWDRRTGSPLGPCVTWQCRRTSGLCDTLREQGRDGLLECITGLQIDPLFSASKVRWLLDALPDGQKRAEAGEVCIGTMDTWLLSRLTNGAVHATDASNASRTQLFDINAGAWSAPLLDLFNIPRAALPEVRASAGAFGEVTNADVPVRAPISGVAGDSHAAMFGHAIFAPGQVKATYGTGSSLMSVLPEHARGAKAGLSSTVAWRLGETLTLALEGNIASTGATIEWVGRLVGDGADPTAHAAELAARATDSGGVFIVPAFAGLGAPHWDDRARGLICGLTRGSTSAHLARAALESIAFQVADVLTAMEQAAGPLETLRADGGASRSDALMQFQADILGRPVQRDRSVDLSAFGVACLAALGLEIWRMDEIRALPRRVDRFDPAIPAGQAESLREGWRIAVQRARLQPDGGRS